MNILEYENYQEVKNHGQIGFPYNTYLCSIPLDFKNVPLHWHQEMELIYIKKGRGRVTVNLEEYQVSGPSLVMILPGQLHSIEQYEDFSMEYENIIFNTNMLLPGIPDYAREDFLTPLISGKISLPTDFTPVYPYYEDVIGPIDACDEICKTKPQGYQLYIKSMLYQFLFVLDNRCKIFSKPVKNQKKLDKIKLVLKYVENNYQDKITIGQIADQVGFSESHFMKYFKENMGTSFVEYLNEYRLTMAARLLLSSEESVLSVAVAAGFDNLSYFNRCFKKRFGMTPLQYRRTGNV